MSQGLREITTSDWHAALDAVLQPRLVAALSGKQAGHCMRVTDLDRDLMVLLAGSLRAALSTTTVVLLADDSLRAQAPALSVSSTNITVAFALRF